MRVEPEIILQEELQDNVHGEDVLVEIDAAANFFDL